ncbi:prolipoprotein diacylglyceryl transferase family protein [Falsirhodobacter sp. 1013]|uniref:TlpA family protein disulfide reductase n=1 Tax=Falsirhodobacter sp. 1013 TaxID=3417566 RepID=UPI003EBC5C86
MGGMQLGPLLLSAERAPVAIALLILVIASWIIGRQRGVNLTDWAFSAAMWSLIGARTGYVLLHLGAFAEQPLSVLAFWQGGFQWQWGIAAFAAATAWHLRRLPLLPVVVAVVLTAIGWNVSHLLARGNAVAMPVDLQLTALDGTPAQVGDWRGEPVVVNLWASWCPPCRREMPMMADVAFSLEGASMRFVNQGEGPEIIRKYLQKTKVPIEPLSDPGQGMMQHYGAKGLPATLFLTADGHLLSAHMGEISRAQLLHEIETLKEDAR